MSTVALRPWQAEFCDRVSGHTRDDFLLVATPAAGKTLACAAATSDLMARRSCDQIIVVCPTVTVREQWVETMTGLGFRVASDWRGDVWPDHLHGVCVTYAQVAFRADRFAAALQRRGTIVVFDEIHHIGGKRAWGDAMVDAFTGARMRLAASGTPFRSDGDRIPFVRYDRRGVCIPDFTYTYADAVADGACRPLRFVGHNGLISWEHNGSEDQAHFSEHVAPDRARHRLRASLDPSQPYLRSLLTAAHADLMRMRETDPTAAGLVVCDDQDHARRVDRLLTSITGSVPTLAISDDPQAHRAIRAFTEDQEPWLVSVRLVSEGVDIPRIGVVAWATASRTELLLRQVAGRALRGAGRTSMTSAIVHLPADPELLAHAQHMRTPAGRGRARDPKTSRSGRPPAGRGARSQIIVMGAHAEGAPQVVEERLPLVAQADTTPVPRTVEPVPVAPSPDEVIVEQQLLEDARADLMRRLTMYAQLRRIVQPAYQIALAHIEMINAVGAVDQDSSAEQVAAAKEWLEARLHAIAAQRPDALREFARQRRRLAAAA